LCQNEKPPIALAKAMPSQNVHHQFGGSTMHQVSRQPRTMEMNMSAASIGGGGISSRGPMKLSTGGVTS